MIKSQLIFIENDHFSIKLIALSYALLIHFLNLGTHRYGSSHLGVVLDFWLHIIHASWMSSDLLSIWLLLELLCKALHTTVTWIKIMSRLKIISNFRILLLVQPFNVTLSEWVSGRKKLALVNEKSLSVVDYRM